VPFDQPLKLRLAHRRDFYVPLFGLAVLVLSACLLSYHPSLLLMLAGFLFGLSWLVFVLDFNRIQNINLISITFQEHRVGIASNNGDDIGGFLSGQQWINRYMAVLHFKIKARTHHIVVLRKHQHPGDYRRLSVGLRQYTRAGNNQNDKSKLTRLKGVE